jgi:predicted XRE-type DNA-binding protein
MCYMRFRKIQVRDRHAAARRGVDRKAIESSARPLCGERENMMTHKANSQGTDNVLTDLGFDDAEKLSAKVVLAVKLNELIDKRGLSQTEAADITGMTQPKVSQVRRYKLQNISLERLMQALVSLDQHVEIIVRPARRAYTAGITVAA